MTDEEAISVAKTEFREAYNTGDVERLLGNSDVVVAVLHHDKLVGFARVLTGHT